MWNHRGCFVFAALLASACENSTHAPTLGDACVDFYSTCCPTETCRGAERELERALEEGSVTVEQTELACRAQLDAARASGACMGTSNVDAAVGIDAGRPDGGAQLSHPLCDQYVRCTASVTPAGLASNAMAYSAGGVCWQTLRPEECIRACENGLNALRNLPGSEIPECALCGPSLACTNSATPACVAGECMECGADSDCGGRGCDLSEHRCVECTADRHCTGSLPACDSEAQRCVACTRDAHCPSSQAHCNTVLNRCEECVLDAHCPSERPACRREGTRAECVECVSSDDCADPARPYCSQNSTCVECHRTPFSEEGCDPGFACTDGHCVGASCAQLAARCGVHPSGNGTIDCGTCGDGLECADFSSEFDPLGFVPDFQCVPPIDSSCNPEIPYSCGSPLRVCVRDGERGVCGTNMDRRECGWRSNCVYVDRATGEDVIGWCQSSRCTRPCQSDAECGGGDARCSTGGVCVWPSDD